MNQRAELVITKQFSKRFKALDSTIQHRVLDKLDDLAERVHLIQHERLTGRTEYKLRIGDWRVLYDLDFQSNRIFLLTVRHRREVYR